MATVEEISNNFAIYLGQEQERQNKIEHLMLNDGGWERWLQLDFAYFLRQNTYTVHTELSILNYRIDLAIQGGTAEANRGLLCEIKVHTINDRINEYSYEHFILRKIQSDIDKLRTIRSNDHKMVCFIGHNTIEAQFGPHTGIITNNIPCNNPQNGFVILAIANIN